MALVVQRPILLMGFSGCLVNVTVTPAKRVNASAVMQFSMYEWLLSMTTCHG
jgi:hypothetical protein